MRGWTRAARIAGVIVSVALAGLAGVSWHYSSEFLVPPRPSTLREQRVYGAGLDWVRLSRDHESEQPGDWALEWPNGYGWARAIRSMDDSSVVRDFRLTQGALPVGEWVSVRGVAKAADPMSLLGLAFSEVTYEGPLGRYPAWLVPGTDSTWLIAVHGLGASRAEALRTVATLAGRGLPMFVIGYRNDLRAPRSPDGHMHLGATEWLDLEAAVRHARERGAKRVLLVGYSMGGQVVMQFLRHSEHAGDVAGAVLESPVLDWTAGLEHRARVLGIPTMLVNPVRWMGTLRAGIDWKALDQVNDPTPLRVPVLLFHGAGDRFAPLAASEAFARAHPREVTIVRYAAGNHVEAWNVDPRAYANALGQWLASLGIVGIRP